MPMLTEIMQYLRNWFVAKKWFGNFRIVDRNLDTQYSNGAEFAGLALKQGQYFRVIGSASNDGVWQYPATDMIDEEFDGAIWALNVPPAIEALAEEIEGWQKKNGATVASPYTSESFGGYSYTKSGSGDGSTSWKSCFASRLAPWRRL